MKKNYTYIQYVLILWILILSIPLLTGETNSLLILRATHLKIICHQMLERYFSFDGAHLIVCARCIGIYIGLFIFSFINIKKFGFYSFTALFATLIDKALESFFGIVISNEIRFCSGLLFSLPFVFLLQTKMNIYETV